MFHRIDWFKTAGESCPRANGCYDCFITRVSEWWRKDAMLERKCGNPEVLTGLTPKKAEGASIIIIDMNNSYLSWCQYKLFTTAL